jgi:membrane associated rhomboid family serine protease
VGASGGTCGLIAAAFLIEIDGRRRKLGSREFLTTTVVFAAINAVLTFVAPYLFGMGIAWEAHVGGYVAGALLMAVLPLRGYGGAKA